MIFHAPKAWITEDVIWGDLAGSGPLAQRTGGLGAASFLPSVIFPLSFRGTGGKEKETWKYAIKYIFNQK
jgi:hypothetical protein